VAVAPTSSNELVALVRKSDLVESKQLDRFLADNSGSRSPVEMARRFVEANLITPFQADQLLQGRTRGFDLGNYRVRKPLGGGATGMVFLCENRLLKKLVAVKVLSGNLLHQDEKSLQRFRREARAAALLEHPNIIRTIDIDEDEGRHFLVMEYVEGCSLDELRKSRTVLPIDDVVHYAIQALQGLQHIADSGLVHRDIKPGNLLLDKQGAIKILDLGLARFTDDRNDNLTVQQGVEILGTVDFMAPEQSMDGQTLDHRADIYGLGATMYFLLTGKTPLPEGPTHTKILASQFHTPERMGQIRPEIDHLLEEIVGKMMAKKVGSRFQHAREVISALHQWQEVARQKAETTPAWTTPVEQPNRRATMTGALSKPPAVPPRQSVHKPKAGAIPGNPTRERGIIPGSPMREQGIPTRERGIPTRERGIFHEAPELLEAEEVDQSAEMTALLTDTVPGVPSGKKPKPIQTNNAIWRIVGMALVCVTLVVVKLLMK
jgi:serine/threonine protein kinase